MILQALQLSTRQRPQLEALRVTASAMTLPQLTARAMEKCQLHRGRAQIWTLLLDQLVMAIEDLQVDAWKWWAEDISW